MIGMGTTIFLVNPQTFGGSSFTNEKSLLFDGVDEYVSLSSTPSALVSATNFSISMWVKLSRTGGENYSVFEFWTSLTDAPARIYYGSTDYIQFGVRNGANALGRMSTTWNAGGYRGNWTHLACVYDGSGATDADKLKIYVNGSNQTLTFPAGAIPSSTSATSSHTYESITGESTFTRGNSDEIAIFDYSLDATQVTSLYNSGTPTDLDNTSGVTAPVHWWRMGDGSDTISTIYDVGTSASNNGTPQNMESGDIVSDTP